MTPVALAEQIVTPISLNSATRVFEPGFGDGAFVTALIRRFLPLHEGPIEQRLDCILQHNIHGIEVDPVAHAQCLARIEAEFGYVPEKHNLVLGDFFEHNFFDNYRAPKFQLDMFFGDSGFDLIVGNPPFGGTIKPSLQDELDRKYGLRNGEKIKKETYSFFLVRCLDQLKEGGQLVFICSDTFLTIPTMRGLRKFLLSQSHVEIETIDAFSEETSYPMVVLRLTRNGGSESIRVNGAAITRTEMELTGNFSWAVSQEFARYFSASTLGDFVVCSSGMTVGKNDLFVREIVDGTIVEPYDFEFFEDPITLEREFQRARLHKLSPKQIERFQKLERDGATRRNVRVVNKPRPEQVVLPHPDYRPYNKASRGIIYSPPTHAIYWKDDGDAVITFKKNGNWYLHGVGGKPFFGKSGLTWQLVASKLNVRFLPEGYILDSGAPCAFLRPGVDAEELFFILGWTTTELCSRILKTVINHTMNIQSKDFEKLPYPWWVSDARKSRAIQEVKSLLNQAMQGDKIDRTHPTVTLLEELFEFPDSQNNGRR